MKLGAFFRSWIQQRKVTSDQEQEELLSKKRELDTYLQNLNEIEKSLKDILGEKT